MNPKIGSRAGFIRHYQTHSKEELLGHVADLHVGNLDMVKRLAARSAQCEDLRKALESLILFTKPSKANAVALNHAHEVLKNL